MSDYSSYSDNSDDDSYSDNINVKPTKRLNTLPNKVKVNPLSPKSYFDFGSTSYLGGANGSDDEKDIEEGEIDEDIEEGEELGIEEGEIIKTKNENEDLGDDEIGDDEDNDNDEDNDEDNDNDEYLNDENEPIVSSKANEIKQNKNINNNASTKKAKSAPIPNLSDYDSDNDDDDEDEIDENYLQKFDTNIKKNYIDEFHQECFSHNYDEISKMTTVVRDAYGIIIDPLHKTIPYLTKYEKTRILGQRAKQIEQLKDGDKPFVKVPENIIDGYIIAELELQQKKIPFIIRRPLPSGGCEYWNLKDLEIISF